MKKQFAFFTYALFLTFLSTPSFGASLDDLYRDIIRSDNQGYLPMYVKNRSAPDVLKTDSQLLQPLPQAQFNFSKAAPVVNLNNPFPEKAAQHRMLIEKWQQTLKAIEENRVTPLELEEINNRVRQNDPKAIEVKAWMYTKGIGVQINYLKAYQLYQKAAALNIPKAQENAQLVFKALNDEQKQKLKGY